MLLLLDIGNSNIKSCLSVNGFLHSTKVFPSSRAEKVAELQKKIGFDKAFICSVVRPVTDRVEKLLRKEGCACHLVGRDLHPSIHSKYDLAMLGSDRLVNIFAAVNLYTPPILLISAGTAMTVDYIDPEGTHVGGMILPGTFISQKALRRKAPALPEFSFGQPESLWAVTTIEALKSGTYHSLHIFVRGLLDTLPNATKVIVTGGGSRLFELENSIIFPELTLQGLMMLS
ncbi:MAG: type III pantothenate kinase [Candidatus Wallbacteria bacterium]|nr:type III pantothenate kinase [Candidatus Wallbacteria bacterium]